jgi:hypothetical protein
MKKDFFLAITLSLLYYCLNSSNELRMLLPSTAGNCGNPSPANSTDCTSSNNQTTYCCYMTPYDGSPNFCNWISPPAYLPSMVNYTLENSTYGIDCDIIEGTQGTPCGVNNPLSPSNCTAFSNSTDSCCYYTGGPNYCFWLGFKGYGTLRANVECDRLSSSFIQIFTVLSYLITALILY